MEETRFKVMQDVYTQLCCRARVELIKKTENMLKELDQGVFGYQRAIVQTLNAIEIKKIELHAMKAIPDEKFKAAEFAAIVTNPDIEDISIEGNRIIVITKNIEIEHGDRVYSMGRYKIYLDVVGSDGWFLKFSNIDTTRQSYPHPHINTDGNPCLGNIKECIPQMIGKNQYAAAIQVSIQYLKSYINEKSLGHEYPFISILLWPSVVKITEEIKEEVIQEKEVEEEVPPVRQSAEEE